MKNLKFRLLIIFIYIAPFAIISLITPQLVFFMVGVGFLITSVIFLLIFKQININDSDKIKKFDKIVGYSSLILFLFLYLGSTITINKDITIYKNGDGYKTSVGFSGNGTPNFQVYIEENSKILEDDPIFFSNGSWFIGKQDTSKFYIQKKKKNCLLCKRTYIKFYYDDKIIPTSQKIH